MNVQAASGIPSLTIGNRVMTDLVTMFILYGYALGTTNTNCTLRLANGTAGYAVTAAKTLTVHAIDIDGGFGNSTAEGLSIGYADNDVGVKTAVAFTNGKYVGGDQLAGAFMAMSSVATSVKQYAIDFQIPMGKYPFMQAIVTNAAANSVRLYGYEV